MNNLQAAAQQAREVLRHAVTDLARAVIGMRWQWRGPSGRLLKVPAPIKTGYELRAMRGAA